MEHLPDGWIARGLHFLTVLHLLCGQGIGNKSANAYYRDGQHRDNIWTTQRKHRNNNVSTQEQQKDNPGITQGYREDTGTKQDKYMVNTGTIYGLPRETTGMIKC